MEIALIVLVGLLQITIGYIPSKWSTIDRRFNFPNYFTKAGWYLIAACFVSLAATTTLYIISEEKQKSSERKNEKKLVKRDSINERKVERLISIYALKIDSSYKKSEDNFVQTAAKFGLHYDTIARRLEMKIDTSKVETYPVIAVDENNGLKLDSTKNGEYHYSLTIKVSDAPAKNFHAKAYFFIEQYDGTLKMVRENKPSFEIQLKNMTKGLKVIYPEHVFTGIKFKTFHCFIVGTYTNNKENYHGTINEFDSYFMYASKGSTFGGPAAPEEQKFRNFLTQQGINNAY